jgi:hypothetical protein
MYLSSVHYLYKRNGRVWQSADLVLSDYDATKPSLELDNPGNHHVTWKTIDGNFYSGKLYYSFKDGLGDWNSVYVIGSDITEPVGYFRGFGALSYCDGYELAWLLPSDCPAESLSDQPNCDE